MTSACLGSYAPTKCVPTLPTSFRRTVMRTRTLAAIHIGRVARLGLRAKRGRRATIRCVVRASVQDFEPQEKELWNRLQLLARQLDVAISEEDYDTAARMRDERANLADTLDQKTQDVLRAVNATTVGSKSERLDAIKTLVQMEDRRCLSALFEGLRDRDSEVSARSESAVWELFCLSGDVKVDNLLMEGMTAMRNEEEWERARDLFSEVIELAPDFAEGYNKRATILYMLENFSEAIDDCNTTVALQPSHFGALSGLGLCHVAMGNIQEAVVAFRKAVILNPRLDQIKSYLTKLERMAEQEGKD